MTRVAQVAPDVKESNVRSAWYITPDGSRVNLNRLTAFRVQRVYEQATGFKGYRIVGFVGNPEGVEQESETGDYEAVYRDRGEPQYTKTFINEVPIVLAEFADEDYPGRSSEAAEREIKRIDEILAP